MSDRDAPNHPSRPCSGALHVEGWCPICGWPETHTQPAEQILGLLNTSRPVEVVTSDRLTRAVLQRAIDAVNASTYEVCPGGGGDRHVVHPLDAEAGGLAPCGGCGAVVDLGPRS